LQTNVCKHVAESKGHHLFGSPQCLGFDFRYGQLTNELCFPSKEVVLEQVKQAVKKVSAVAVFVATDYDPMTHQIEAGLNGKVSILVG
jgi:hypothetical protein